MITNSHADSATFEPLQASGAEALSLGCELSANRSVIHAKRILLVDDEEPLRAYLRMMLELDGHQVTEAGNGAEALNLFTLGEFDLVITDFEMPVMKGNELAVNLKLLAPTLPILMVTASEQAARGNLENPVDVLLNKPVTVPTLRCALGNLLSARLAPAQPDAVLV